MDSSGSGEESSDSDSYSSSSSVLEVWGGHRCRAHRSSSSEEGVDSQQDSDSSSDECSGSSMSSAIRSSPRLARRRSENPSESEIDASSPASREGVSASAGERALATPYPSCKSPRTSRPKQHHDNYGNMKINGGRSVQSEGGANGGGGSLTSPLNFASSQDSAPSAGAAASLPPSSRGVDRAARNRMPERPNQGRARATVTARRKTGPTQGGSKLWQRDGEKVAFHLLIQELCPTQHGKRKLTKRAWQEIVRRLRKEQFTLRLTDREGKTREVVVNMGPSMEGQTEDALLKKLKDKFDSDRRSFLERAKEEEKLTGEGTTDAGEVAESTEDAELRNAVEAWEWGKAKKKSAKILKAEHAGKGKKNRKDATDDPISDSGEGGAASEGATSRGKGKGGGKGKGKAKGRGEGERREKRKRTKKTSSCTMTYAQQVSRNSYACAGIFSEDSDSDVKLDSDTGESKGGSDWDSSSDDSGDGTRLADEEQTELASDRAGRSTRSAPGGGKRKKTVPTLAEGGPSNQMERVMMRWVREIMEDRRQERANRTAGARAGGMSGSGDALTRDDFNQAVAGIEDRLGSKIEALLSGRAGANGVPQQYGAAGHHACLGAPQQHPPYPAAGVAGLHASFPQEAWQQHPPYAAAGVAGQHASFTPGARQQHPSYPAAGVTGQHASFTLGAPQQHPLYPAAGAAGQRSPFPYAWGSPGAGAAVSAVGVTSGAHAAGGHSGGATAGVRGGAFGAAPTTAASAAQPMDEGGMRGTNRGAPLPGFAGAEQQGNEGRGGDGAGAAQGSGGEQEAGVRGAHGSVCKPGAGS